MKQIACLGILVADVVGFPIDAFPAKGTLAAVERMELHVGGCAANTSLALAKLGLPVSLLGGVGADGFGDFLLDTLREAGVDVRGVLRGGGQATSATMVAVDTEGERTFLHYPGANAAFTEEHVNWDALAGAEILHVGGPFLMPRFMPGGCAAVLRQAQERGMVTTLDTVWDASGRWMEALEPSLPFLDYLLPSWEEACHLTGRTKPSEIAQVFLDGGVKTVGLKMGAKGAYFQTADGQAFTVPPLTVPVVDALGAGDAWSAGFLCGLAHGWDLEKTARFANAVGACAVQALGATAGILGFAETCALAFREEAVSASHANGPTPAFA